MSLLTVRIMCIAHGVTSPNFMSDDSRAVCVRKITVDKMTITDIGVPFLLVNQAKDGLNREILYIMHAGHASLYTYSVKSIPLIILSAEVFVRTITSRLSLN